MTKPNKPKSPYKGVNLGPLPAQLVGSYLNMHMEPGNVFVTKMAHKHMAEDHPNDYALCFANLQTAIRNPNFIGQDPKHARSFIIVKRIPGPQRNNMLVAISLERNDYGFYTVRSSYLISQEDVDRRRGHSLQQVQPPAQNQTAPDDPSEAVD